MASSMASSMASNLSSSGGCTRLDQPGLAGGAGAGEGGVGGEREMGGRGAELRFPSPLRPLLLLRLTPQAGAALVPHAVALAVQGDVRQLVQAVPQGPTATVGGAGPEVVHHAVLHVVVVDVATTAVSLQAAVVLFSTGGLLPVELERVGGVTQW